MKHLVYILLGLMLVGVFSCRRSPGGTEARLVAIDSLITAKPDSALALLADINADSLPADLRAYHDVLTTQALYKAYIPATTDTLIARAWSYYRDHGPYDRRIRAMLYSGTTAEELGHPDSAMRWYKRTELESRPDDHYHRAYAQMSIAKIFQDHYIYSWAISYYRLALNDYDKTNLVSQRIYCIKNLGALYRKDKPDSAKIYLQQAITIAKAQHDTIQYYDALSFIAGYFNTLHLYHHALDTAQKVLRESSDYYSYSEAIYAACEAACELNMTDSASRLFRLLPKPVNSKDSFMNKYIQGLISLHKNDPSSYHTSMNDIEELSDNLILNKYRDNLLSQLQDSQREFDRQAHHQSLKNAYIILIILLAITLIALSLISLVNAKRSRAESKVQLLKSSNAEIKEILERVRIENNEIKAKLKNAESNGRIIQTKAFQLQTVLISTLLNEHSQKLAKDLNLSNEQKTLWGQMRDFADASCSNIISKLELHYPSISERDKKLIILFILGCSVDTIALALGYTNRKSVSNRLRIMPKEIMGLDLTVKQLITNARSGIITFPN